MNSSSKFTIGAHNQPTFWLMVFMIGFLVSCVGDNSLPKSQSGDNSTSPIPPLIKINKQPTSTSASFKLDPTFTPQPTTTPFVIEALSYEGGNGPVKFSEGINPLTGLSVYNPSLLERRPMVVKVTNFPRQVRPQWGLSRADHIYEYYLEDGLTRFVGVFYGQEADRIGPIRSARPFDEQLMRMYKGIFAFGYADRRVYDALIETDIRRYLVIQRPGNCPPMCRIGPDYDYNTLYTNTAQLSQYIIEKGFENNRQILDGLRFMVSKAHGGGLANYIFTRFSRSSYNMWQYDPSAHQYLRSQELESRDEGEEVHDPLFDNLTGERISADNLIILFVPALQYFKSNSTDIYNFNLIGSGKAYAMRDGRIFKILWSRPSSESMIRLVLPNGNNYPLKPGNVWFEVLTSTSTYKVEDNGLWRFTFDLGL